MGEILNEITQKVALLEQHRDILADGLSEVKGKLDALNDNLITLGEFKEEVEKGLLHTVEQISALKFITAAIS